MTRDRDSPHPGPEELRRRARGREHAAGIDVDRHLESCRSCRDELALLITVEREMSSIIAGDCPPAEILVRLAGGFGIEPRRRVELETHLTACVDCAADLEGLARADQKARVLPSAPPLIERGLSALERQIRALVSFEMPPSLALVTRNRVAAGRGSALERGMAAYRAERYGDARRRLEAAHAAGEKARELPFYLGACLLRAGQVAAAVEMLREAVRRSPRLGEYRWYLAQALMKEGRGAEAATELARAARLPGPYRDRARELRKTLGELMAQKR